MSKSPMVVANQTGDTLKVTGHRGSDLSEVAVNSEIPPNSGKIVAWYDTPGALSDNWDWVYLQNLNNNDQYQIYIEWRRPQKKAYSFFGYQNSDRSQSNSNPSPFPPDCATCNYTTSDGASGWAGYILNKVPPLKS